LTHQFNLRPANISGNKPPIRRAVRSARTLSSRGGRPLITAYVGNKIWLNHGSATDRRVSRERQNILTLLNRHPDGLRPRELADLLGKNSGAIRGLLWKMTDDGQVRTEGGKYITALEKKDNAA